jgi:hypothetical protein
MSTTTTEKFSPSHLKNVEICPHWRAKEFEENEWTKEGKLLHACLEKPEDKTLRHPLTQEQLEQLKTIEEIISPIIKGSLNYWREIKLLLPELFEIKELRNGIIDLLCHFGKGRYRVVDFKFGRNPVDNAQSNIQLAIYAAGVFLAYPDAKEVEVTILQPRLGTEGTTTRVFQWPHDFTPIFTRIKEIVENALNPLQLHTPEGDNCRDCSKYFTCPAVNSLLAQSSPSVNSLLPIARNDLEQMLEVPESAEKVLRFAVFCEDWAKRAKKQITDKVTEGELDLPGYKMIQVRGRKSIRDAEGFKQWVLSKITKEEALRFADLDLKTSIDYLETVGYNRETMERELTAADIYRQEFGYSYLKAKK